MKKYYRQRMLQFLLLAILFVVLAGSKTTKGPKWTPLFNGKDLSGWDTFLSYVPESGSKEILGVNKDPEGVFSVVDGNIRISGKIWGALTSKEEFENYHLRFQFKWGEKKWPPREKAKRDSGVLYHCVGPHGAQSDHWMRSHETQVQEGDCGDYHSLDGARMDLAAESIEMEGKPELQYKPGAEIVRGVKQRVVKLRDKERYKSNPKALKFFIAKLKSSC